MHEYLTHDQYVNHDGTTDQLSDGEQVSTAVKSAFGGKDYYDNQHNLEFRSSNNPEDGTDFSDGAGNLVAKTIPNSDGSGHTIYTPGMKEVANIVPHPGDGEWVIGPDAALIASTQPLGHGFVDVMHHGDPLVHTNDYEIPLLDLNS
jgi:hypothetical protein